MGMSERVFGGQVNLPYVKQLKLRKSRWNLATSSVEFRLCTDMTLAPCANLADMLRILEGHIFTIHTNLPGLPLFWLNSQYQGI